MDHSRLVSSPTFSLLDADDLDAVASVASEADIQVGTELTTEGDFGHSPFAIESGTADVSRDGAVDEADHDLQA